MGGSSLVQSTKDFVLSFGKVLNNSKRPEAFEWLSAGAHAVGHIMELALR